MLSPSADTIRQEGPPRHRQSASRSELCRVQSNTEWVCSRKSGLFRPSSRQLSSCTRKALLRPTGKRWDKIATRYAQVYFVHSGYVLLSQPLCRKGNLLAPNRVPGGTRFSAPTRGSRLTGYGCLAARRLPCSCASRSLSPGCSDASPTTSPGDRARTPARYD